MMILKLSKDVFIKKKFVASIVGCMNKNELDPCIGDGKKEIRKIVMEK